MREVVLPSGAKLQISPSPFLVSKALFQSILEEAKSLKLDPQAEIDVNMFKDMFCGGFSSRKIELCLNECLKKVLYNGLRIDEETFEPDAARQDYVTVCWEVILENVTPFTKALTSKFSAILGSITKPSLG